MNHTIHDTGRVLNICEESPEETSQRKPPVQKLEAIEDKTGVGEVSVPTYSDSPLTVKELKMAFGRPLLQGGIDYGIYIGKYMQAVHHIQPEDVLEEETSALPLIGELARHGAKIALQVNIELLISHDAQVHRQENCRSFEKWVNLQGLKMNHSTIDRSLNHARVLLIFAASGGLDTLPNQAQANALVSLPRSHWLPFFRQALAWKSAGKAAIERMLPVYARTHQITLPDVPLDTPPPLPSTEPTTRIEGPSTQGEPEVNQESLKSEETRLRQHNEAVEAHAAFLSQFAEFLTDYLPVYRQQSLAKKHRNAAKHYLGTLNKNLRNKCDPAKVEQRVGLYQWLQEHNPKLAEQIHKAALGNFFGAVDKGL